MAPVGEGAIRVTTGEGADIGFPVAGSGPAGEGAFAPRPAGAAGLNTRIGRLPSLGRVWGGLRGEVAAQADRAFLWTPVAYGLGAAAYLGLKSEPPLWPLIWAAALGAAVAAAAR